MLTKYFSYLGWPILAIGILGTVIATTYVYRVGRNEDIMRLEYEADQATRRVQYQLDRYESALIQTRAFFYSSDYISREEFQRYFTKTKLLQRYPGIQGLGFSVKLNPRELQQHIKKMRLDIPTFNIWPKGRREFYTSIMYLEPDNEKNRRAMGFDMYSEPVRREAMKRAWETGLPAISGKIYLVQGEANEPQPGFNYYIPYYQDDDNFGTIEQRRKSLIGFIYSPVRSNQFFSSTFGDINLSLNIEIFDGEEMSNESLLFKLEDPKSSFSDNHKRRIVKRLIVGGRSFTLLFTPSRHHEHNLPFYAPVFVAIIGLLFTILIYRIFWITKNQAEISKASEFALQEALRVRDEFLSIASHELKTPLTSLKLQAQLIQRSLAKNDPKAFSKETMQVLADQTDRQTHRIIRLVDDMLDISRIRTGRLTIEKEKLDLNQVVKEVILHMEDQFERLTNGKPKIQYARDAVGFWDKVRIEQVVINLLTNAIKYGKDRPIEISISSNQHSVFFKIQDYGIGIGSSSIDKIFDRFERGGLSANEISGLGLGLFITKQIVLAHQGKVWVESKKGEGSIFTVELPRNT